MPKLIKSFTSVSGSVVNPTGFRSARPARAKLVTIPVDPNDEAISVMFPFGPQDLDHSNLAGKTVEIQRPGRKPLLFHENQSLRTVSFKAVIAHKESGGTQPITDILDKLETLAAAALPCSFIYGLTALSYTVAITKLSFEITYRNSSGEPLRAEADVQLTEMPSFSQDIAFLKAVLRDAAASTTSYTKSFGSETGAVTSPTSDSSSEATSNLSFDTGGRTFYYTTESLAEHAAYVASLGDAPRDYTPEVTQSAIEAAVALYEAYQPPPADYTSKIALEQASDGTLQDITDSSQVSVAFTASSYNYDVPLSYYTAVYKAPTPTGGSTATYL